MTHAPGGDITARRLLRAAPGFAASFAPPVRPLVSEMLDFVHLAHEGQEHPKYPVVPKNPIRTDWRNE